MLDYNPFFCQHLPNLRCLVTLWLIWTQSFTTKQEFHRDPFILVPAVGEILLFYINHETNAVCWYFGVQKHFKWASWKNYNEEEMKKKVLNKSWSETCEKQFSNF